MGELVEEQKKRIHLVRLRRLLLSVLLNCMCNRRVQPYLRSLVYVAIEGEKKNENRRKERVLIVALPPLAHTHTT